MSVLARREGESIVIGDNIEVTVISVQSGGNVRLGITAPRPTVINRKEVHLKIQREKMEGGKATNTNATVQENPIKGAIGSNPRVVKRNNKLKQ